MYSNVAYMREMPPSGRLPMLSFKSLFWQSYALPQGDDGAAHVPVQHQVIDGVHSCIGGSQQCVAQVELREGARGGTVPNSHTNSSSRDVRCRPCALGVVCVEGTSSAPSGGRSFAVRDDGHERAGIERHLVRHLM